jgi:hypothetical protein
MGRIRKPDGLPPDSAAEALYSALHDLHERAGRPSTREIGKHLTLTPTRVYKVFRGDPVLPNRPILLKIVESLAGLALMPDARGQIKRFDTLWEAVRTETST